MKTSLAVLTILLPLVAVAAVQPAINFSDQTIKLPPLSLAEIPPPNPLGVLREAGAFFASTNPPAVLRSKKLFSRMPIGLAGSEVDSKMIKAPNASIDYKLIVKAPDMESAR